jgi:hypothetical protein
MGHSGLVLNDLAVDLSELQDRLPWLSSEEGHMTLKIQRESERSNIKKGYQGGAISKATSRTRYGQARKRYEDVCIQNLLLHSNTYSKH